MAIHSSKLNVVTERIRSHVQNDFFKEIIHFAPLFEVFFSSPKSKKIRPRKIASYKDISPEMYFDGNIFIPVTGYENYFQIYFQSLQNLRYKHSFLTFSRWN